MSKTVKNSSAPIKSGVDQRRFLGASFMRSDENENEYTLSFSSETPYTRYFGNEILEHTEKSVNLKRLSEIGTLLFNHDINKVIGSVKSCKIENGRGVAVVEFDPNDDEALKIKSKVESGILKGVSVRYTVDVWEQVMDGKKSSDGRFNGPCYIAKKWEPLEISIVSVPADASVGVGRQQQNFNTKNDVEGNIMNKEENLKIDDTSMINVDKILSDERQRISDINDLCREFDMESSEFVKSDASIDDVRRAIIEKQIKEKTPIGNITVKDNCDDFKKAAVESLLLRSGVKNTSDVKDADDFRQMRITDLLRYTARLEGVRSPETMSPDDLMRHYFTPSSAFSEIMNQTINNSYVEGYETAPATFDVWTSKGDLKDFKPTKAYTVTNASELLHLPENGEMKHDNVSTEILPERQLKTYGRQFTLSRQAIINDDIDMVTKIPAAYARTSRFTINKAVYDVLSGNPVIHDGIQLFDDANHSNIISPGSAPDKDSLQKAIIKMALQTNNQGLSLNVIPKYIICPVGLGFAFNEILTQRNLVSDGNVINNPFITYGLQVIEDATLNTLDKVNGSFAWYMAADYKSIPTIQVDYLNGQEIPTIRMMEYPGQLGLVWDIYHDWSITVMEYRGLLKNDGK